MPLWKRLAIILGGVLLVVAVAIARVEYLSQYSPEPPAQENYAAEIYQRYLESLQASLLYLCKSIGGYFGGFVSFVDSHDKFIVALSTIFIAIFTVVLGVATVKLWKSTDNLHKAGIEQLVVTKTAADAAKASADASLVALRPWLSCEVKAAGPLVFSKGDAVFKFSFIVKNVGRSPAMRIKFTPHMTLFSPKHEPAILWVKKMADHNRSMPVEVTTILIPSGVSLGSEETGLVLFPSESHTFNYILRNNRDDIEESCEDLKIAKARRYIMPIVCGLVTYNYPLARVRANTGFAYPIRKASGKTRGLFYLSKSVPQKNIIFDTDFSGDGFAS